MRRLLIAVVAAVVALSPIAFYGATGGAHVAHADLGWCPECDIVVIGGGSLTPGAGVPAPIAPGPVAPASPVQFPGQ